MADTECQGCGAICDEGDLIWPIPDVDQRVGPGEEMPAGECRDCGAVAHLVGRMA